MFNFVSWETIIILILALVIFKGHGVGVSMIQKDSDSKNILEKFREIAKNYGDKPAIKIKKKDQWSTITYKDYYKYCRRFAGALQALNLQKGDTVCLIGYNSFPLFVSILGSMMAGCIPVPIYPSMNRDICEQIVQRCQPMHLFVSDNAQLVKFLELLYSEDCSIRSVSIVGTYPKDETVNARIFRWYDLVNSVKKFDPVKISPNDIATLIHTSGSSGSPKPVILTFKNLSAMHNSLIQRLSNEVPKSPVCLEMGKERIMSYLPVTHIASQTIDLYLPIYLATTVYIADPKVLQSKRKLGQHLREIRPTIFMAVPRVWEKMIESVEKKHKTLSGLDALEVNILSSLTSLPNLQIQRRLGLDQTKYCMTLGAPTSDKIHRTMREIGVPIYEVYGLSETAGPVTLSTPNLNKHGSVGKALPNVQIKIQKKKNSQEGIIFIKGDTVTLGYYQDPSSTHKVFTQDRWFNTGDVGYLDDDGYLFLTGRDKDIIITSGGENVAPTPIEEKLVQEIPIISQAIVIGDGRKYLTALLVPKLEFSPDGEPTIMFTKKIQRMLKDLGTKTTTIIEAEDDKVVLDLIRNGVASVNQSAPSRVHEIKKWSLLPTPITEKEDLVTPTMKLKRKAVESRFKDLVASMYTETQLMKRS